MRRTGEGDGSGEQGHLVPLPWVPGTAVQGPDNQAESSRTAGVGQNLSTCSGLIESLNSREITDCKRCPGTFCRDRSVPYPSLGAGHRFATTLSTTHVISISLYERCT